ncbi:DUF3048 domain-containing protein [Candidatus Berkelbacteria bacterium]|nr:DUF3048 domain-containing protein [Candidatus Berkelbacteria bacterium]
MNEQKPRLIDSLKVWLSKPKNKALFIIGILVLSLTIIVGLISYKRYFKAETQTPTDQETADSIKNVSQEEKPKLDPSVVDGTMVEPEIANRRPLAVMVENHPQARPQAGLINASQVWEAIVEGGITRFMAVFSSQDAEKIGPVRSARPYFVNWASGYHALYVHAGGSQAGLAAISSSNNIVDLPHTNGYFHREPQPGIASEHTLFTSTADLYDFASKKEVSLEADFETYQFSDEAQLEQRPAEASIAIDFSSPSYKVDWTYDRDLNTYKRNLAGEPHVDRVTGDQIAVKNVITVTVNRRYDPNTNHGKGEWFMDTEGEGSALIFQNGQVTKATWKKPTKGSSLKLFDENNQEIKLVRGKSWFEVVPPDISVIHEEIAVLKTPTTTQ